MGPHTFNFAQAAELALAAGAAERVGSIEAGVARAVALSLGDEGATMASQALAFAAEHRGAADRMVRQILLHLPG